MKKMNRLPREEAGGDGLPEGALPEGTDPTDRTSRATSSPAAKA